MSAYTTLLYLLLFALMSACSSNNESSINHKKITLSPCPPLDSNILYSDVRLQNYTYTRSKMMFMPQNLRLGGMTPFSQNRTTSTTKKGNHLHLCIDGIQHHISNENIFDYPLENGRYKLVAFIARSFYESIKEPAAILAKEITVQNGELIASKNLQNVDLVYNAPLGTYQEEEAQQLLLDFVLVGTTINEGGNTVKITIDQETTFTVDRWQAYFIEGLTVGKHHIQLELLDATGKQIAAPTHQDFVIVAAAPAN
ncbi:hypothetical protein [Aureispira anguillae]|uniref:Phosphopeptide-binding protein n=1 Tax=Aureispira anguillae TaxID=2864201 RepID=A0A916DTU2_9BACT|nr:hypothetical protein [Aureispira anguillae]BDS11741.1 hypothetical protein AsAng_0024550 [Aureispira anguillae]